jgi:hypothetical protein
LDAAAIMARGQTGLEAERKSLPLLGFTYFKASVSAIGLVAACAAEMFSLTVALHAQYPALSDGIDLGAEMLSMRYGIGAVMLLAPAVLHDDGNATAGPIRRFVRKARLVPVMAILGGMATFMFASVSQSTGVEGDRVDLAGLGLGIVCGGLFAASFLASNVLMGKLLSALRTILGARDQRERIADIERELAAADACASDIAALRRSIADKEAPDALIRKAADEAAAVVGKIASREATGDVELGPDDTTDIPDVPLAALDRLQSYLKQFTPAYFVNLLKKGA